MKRLGLVIALFMGFAPGLSAQRVLTASGSYTYYAPTNITLDQAKAIALERAKNQIIADHFGTVVGVMNHTRIANSGEESSVSFLSLGESEVKGEWLETIGNPVFEVNYEENLQVVKVFVKGTFREIISARIPVEVHVLRNGISDKYESDRFKDGDELYLSFLSPEGGYVAVYLYDSEGVHRLLPLKYDSEGSRSVKTGVREVFFANRVSKYSVSEDKVIESIRSEYVVTCDQDSELNRIYVVFSPHIFARPNDRIPEDDTVPAFLSFEQFQRWLAKSRKQDKDMSVTIKDILIQKP